jgi:hypothetical protein
MNEHETPARLRSVFRVHRSVFRDERKNGAGKLPAPPSEEQRTLQAVGLRLAIASASFS